MAILSGKRTVTAAGTAVRLSPASRPVNGPVMVKALAANAGLIYIGDAGEGVSAASGLELAAGEAVVFQFVGDLASLWLDASLSGEGAAWLLLEA